LQTLYDKALFMLALQLAKSRGIGREGIADVHRRYADWLYEKGDWEGSVGQYVKTIGGGVQGSYVIRKVCRAFRRDGATRATLTLFARTVPRRAEDQAPDDVPAGSAHVWPRQL
jgi:hypothetical protein